MNYEEILKKLKLFGSEDDFEDEDEENYKIKNW